MDPSVRDLPALTLLGMQVEVQLLPWQSPKQGVVLAVGIFINLMITNSK
jgi:hypothetical protein